MNASVWCPSATKRASSIGGLDVRRRARAAVRVEQRSLPHRERALGPRGGRRRRSRSTGQAAQLRRELGRVADRRAGEAERRVGPVVLAQPSQPPQHVRDVAAEEPAQRVQLVDHDVAQPHEERRPLLRATGRMPDVQHLGVGEQHVRVGACPRRARRARCRRRRSTRRSSGTQPLAQRAELVLRERLGGEDEQRGVAALARAPIRRSAAGSRATSPTRCRWRPRCCDRRAARRSRGLVLPERGDAVADHARSQRRVTSPATGSAKRGVTGVGAGGEHDALEQLGLVGERAQRVAGVRRSAGRPCISGSAAPRRRRSRRAATRRRRSSRGCSRRRHRPGAPRSSRWPDRR